MVSNELSINLSDAEGTMTPLETTDGAHPHRRPCLRALTGFADTSVFRPFGLPRTIQT